MIMTMTIMRQPVSAHHFAEHLGETYDIHLTCSLDGAKFRAEESDAAILSTCIVHSLPLSGLQAITRASIAVTHETRRACLSTNRSR